jgi:hypothetical protein
LERTVGIDGQSFRIVGVVERQFPGLLIGFPARIYIPLRQVKLPPDLPYAVLGQTVFARLRDGDTLAGIVAHLDATWPAWVAATAPTRLAGTERERYLKTRPRVTSATTGIDYTLRGRFAKPLTALVMIASLVLLVAAINVANLLLARAADRRRDTAVRLALGATRQHIAQRLLIESVMVITAAAAIGGLIAPLPPILIDDQRDQQHLQFHFLARFVRIRRRTGQPAFHLLQRNRMHRAGLSDFDLEDGGRTDFFEPGILVQAADAQNGGFVERLGLHAGGMADSAHVLEADNARMGRHGSSAYHEIRFMFAEGCPTAQRDPVRQLMASGESLRRDHP